MAKPPLALRAPGWVILVAGLPHGLYGLIWYGPLWFYDLKTYGLAILANPAGLYPRYGLAQISWAQPAFWLLAAGLSLIGLRRATPRWSAGWLGYGLLGLLDQILHLDPAAAGLVILLGLIWLTTAAGMIFWLGWRDPLTGLLVLLPLMPMAGWALGMETLISNLEGFVYVPAALTVAGAAGLAVWRGRFDVGLAASLAAIIVAGLPINFGITYFPSPTFPAPANLGAVALGTCGDLLAFTLAGLPLWLALFRRRLGPA